MSFKISSPSKEDILEITKARIKALVLALFWTLVLIVGGYLLLGWQGGVFAILIVAHVNGRVVSAALESYITTVETFTDTELS